ncbi:unnamed protein product [Ilex paraguariensis]|uniref:Uncharacterized protein n=1 Tax=Ilex paraguariensis TaxID=185542 RepID=A0ABC8SK68_9AQUA
MRRGFNEETIGDAIGVEGSMGDGTMADEGVWVAPIVVREASSWLPKGPWRHLMQEKSARSKIKKGQEGEMGEPRWGDTWSHTRPDARQHQAGAYLGDANLLA